MRGREEIISLPVSHLFFLKSTSQKYRTEYHNKAIIYIQSPQNVVSLVPVTHPSAAKIKLKPSQIIQITLGHVLEIIYIVNRRVDSGVRS